MGQGSGSGGGGGGNGDGDGDGGGGGDGDGEQGGAGGGGALVGQQRSVEEFTEEVPESEGLEAGTTAYDPENDGEVLLTEVTDEEAGDFEIEGTGKTVAEFNEAYDEEAAVVKGVYLNDVEDAVDLEEVDQAEVAAMVRDGELSAREYSFPADRVRGEFDPSALDDLTQYDDMQEALVAAYGSMEAAREDALTSWQYGHDTAVDGALDTADFQSEMLPEISERWSEFEDFQQSPEEYDAVVIHDGGDADGATCGTLYEEKFGDDAVRVPGDSGGNYGRGVEDGLEKAFEADGETPVYVADLSPSDPERFEELVRENDNPVYVRDHHEVAESAQQRQAIIDAVEESGGEYLVDTDEPSAAKMVWENDIGDGDVSDRETMADAVEVATVADDFQADHERWDDALQMRSLQFEYTLGEFEETVSESGGDLSGTAAARTINLASEMEALRSQQALGTAETFETSGYTGVRAYAGGGDRSVVAMKAMAEHDTDFAVVATENDKLSFRARSDGPAVNEIAAEYDGGGRAEAAGAKGFGFDSVGTTREDHHENVGDALLSDAVSTAKSVLGSGSDEGGD